MWFSKKRGWFRTCSLIGALSIGLLAGCGGGGSSGSGSGNSGNGDGSSGGSGGQDSGTPPPVVTTATLKGVITTGTGSAQKAVAGVTVAAAGQSAVTDAQGRYSLALDKPGDSAVVLARKDGYLSMSKEAPVHAGATTTQDITLYSEDVRTTFAADQGKIVVVNGAVIDIPANAIKDATGAPYNGAVTLAASYRNPTTADGVDAFPQPYQGLNSGDTVTLQTVGVIEAQLFDPNGQRLQLRQSATLTFPGVSAIDKGADSIPLWWYDDTRAIWVREGQAQRLADGSYQGQVAHFTQWNLDVFYGNGYSQASITVCIKFQNGAATRSGISMELSGPGILSHLWGEIAAGDLKLVYAPVNTALTLSIMDAGSGLTTTLSVPPVANGGNVKLPCQTLVGTNNYVPPPPPPPPVTVPANAPGSVFAGKYGFQFWRRTAAGYSEYGSLSFTVGPTGSIAGTGSTWYYQNQAIQDDGVNFSLTLSGQVAAGGYVTMTATPIAAAGGSFPPYASLGFTGQFPMTIPNNGPSGTWIYNGYTGPAFSSTPGTMLFSPNPCGVGGLCY